MPRYSSQEKISSSLPLGGIGAGKIEIYPNGLLGQANLYNNWESPTKGPLSPSFAIRVKNSKGVEACLLEAGSSEQFQLVDSLKMEARFPVAELQYKKTNISLDIILRHSCHMADAFLELIEI